MASMKRTIEEQPEGGSESPPQCPTPAEPAPSSTSVPIGDDTAPHRRQPGSRHRKPKPGPNHPLSLQVSSSPLVASSIASPPFSPLDPYTERAYLYQALRHHDDRARRLLARLSAAADRLAQPPRGVKTVGGEARRTRKEISLLRAKAADNAQQERRTLLRLGDLYAEIQGRERWEEAVRGRLGLALSGGGGGGGGYYPVQHPCLMPSAPPTTAVHGTFPAYVLSAGPSGARLEEEEEEEAAAVVVCWHPSPTESVPTPSFASGLSPLSPDFVPGGLFAGDVSWPDAGGSEGGMDEAAGEEPGEEKAGRGPYTPTSSSARGSSVPRPAVCVPVRERRVSDPAPRTVWPDGDALDWGRHEEAVEG